MSMKKKKKKVKKVVDLDALEEPLESTKNDEVGEDTNKENQVVQEKEVGEIFAFDSFLLKILLRSHYRSFDFKHNSFHK